VTLWEVGPVQRSTAGPLDVSRPVWGLGSPFGRSLRWFGGRGRAAVIRRCAAAGRAGVVVAVVAAGQLAAASGSALRRLNAASMSRRSRPENAQ